ncbi:hypothetical protein ACFQ6N_31930 [Kitasatospora sp. NPDC056446]|uniref:hypothetical protein n=1 Tax=Kitasatospora sp. NPDC056446 TaxID=3345819 RepID=UPI003680212A
MHHLLPTFSDEVTAKVLVFTLTFIVDLIRQALGQRAATRTGRQRSTTDRPWREEPTAKPSKSSPRTVQRQHRGRAEELHRVKNRITRRAAQPAPVVPARPLLAPRRRTGDRSRPGNRRS